MTDRTHFGSLLSLHIHEGEYHDNFYHMGDENDEDAGCMAICKTYTHKKREQGERECSQMECMEIKRNNDEETIM